MASNRASSLIKVSNRVLSDHQGLQGQLSRIELTAVSIARSGEPLPRDAERLRQEVGQLVAHFERHLAYEDSRLVPLIAMLDGWGAAQASAMRKEHHEQRELLHLLASEAMTTDALTLAREVQRFAREVRAEMNNEERDLRQLSEDANVSDQCTG